MSHCHCGVCRKLHGAAYATYVGVRRENLRWLTGEDQVQCFATSPTASRRFCRRCGSITPAPAISAVEAHLAFMPAGSVDGVTGARPECHIFVGSKAVWHEITDDLPRFDCYPPEPTECTDDAALCVPAMKRLPSTPGSMRGSCICGAVSWQAGGGPTGIYSCHCTRCRKARGTAHASNIFTPEGEFRWLGGEDQLDQFALPDAERFGVCFCRICGSKQPRASGGRMTIPAGAVDGDPGVREELHIFVASRADWDTPSGELPQYDEYPPAV